MLHLFFSLGNQRYAFPGQVVRQIIPNVRLRAMPRSPEWIKGLLNYHESVVPVIDLSILMGGPPVPNALGNRIILVEHASRADCEGLIGLLAEKVLEVSSVSDDEIHSCGVPASGARGLGRVVIRRGDMVHLVEPDELFSDEQKGGLFPEAAGGDS